jgi:regulator of sirC expression with transglutaminase-like and TPR domain
VAKSPNPPFSGPIPELWSLRDAEAEDNLKHAAAEGDLLSTLMAIEGLGTERGMELAELVANLAVQTRLSVDAGLNARDALVEVLVGSFGLRGDTDDYHAPENSLISRVLERGKGQPILISSVWLLVGRAAGLDVVGVGLPGHFVVGVEDVIVDPFHGGRYLSLEQCKELAARALPGRPFEHAWLAPVTVRQIGERVLRNLLRSLREFGDERGAYRALRMLASISESDASLWLELAQVTEQIGAWPEALALYRRIGRQFADRREGQVGEMKALELESRSRTLN